jgi:hypothetical protein
MGKSGSQNGVYRPIFRDFSQKTISRKLANYAITHWSVQYSFAALILSILGGFLITFSQAWFLITVVIGGCGGFSWAYRQFFMKEKFERDYIKKMQQEIAEETERKRRCLADDLTKQGCGRGVKQLGQLQREYDSLIELLRTKLDENEVTFQRYLAMAQGVFLSGIDNLRKVMEALMSVDEIDETDIQTQIRTLKSPRCTDPRKEGKINALQARLDSLNAQREKVEDLLFQNEQAITQLSTTATTLADMDVGLDEGKIGMQGAMEDLIRIVQSARRNIEAKEIAKTV